VGGWEEAFGGDTVWQYFNKHPEDGEIFDKVWLDSAKRQHPC
jgi:hypothetical protein